MYTHDAFGVPPVRSAPIAHCGIGSGGDYRANHSRTLTFLIEGRTIQVLVTLNSGQQVDGLAGSPAVALVDPALLQEVLEQEARFGARDFDSAMAVIGRDPAADSLIRALAEASTRGLGSDDSSPQSIGTALVVRALALFRVSADVLLCRGRRAPMPKWRLKRVLEYIDANLYRTILVAEMADVAGLNQIYFATQFRRTTGMSPHNFLLQRRINRAKDLMRVSDRSLADIALTVGFGAQPHFTTVFKRLAGDTPYRWRQSARMQAA